MRLIGRPLLAGLVALSLVFTAVAFAKVKKLDVDVNHDSGAKLAMKLSTKNKTPKEMQGVKASKLQIMDEGACEPIVVNHNFGTLQITKVTFPSLTYSFQAQEAGEAGLTYRINGSSRDGKKWSGSVVAFHDFGGFSCSTGNVPFEAK